MKRYKIETNKRVEKFLEKHRDIALKYIDALEILEQFPFENTLDVKMLVGKKFHYRLRIGKYRFLYEVRENEILIYFYDADSRGSIYK